MLTFKKQLAVPSRGSSRWGRGEPAYAALLRPRTRTPSALEAWLVDVVVTTEPDWKGPVAVRATDPPAPLHPWPNMIPKPPLPATDSPLTAFAGLVLLAMKVAEPPA